jgi:hypothetical protein
MVVQVHVIARQQFAGFFSCPLAFSHPPSITRLRRLWAA